MHNDSKSARKARNAEFLGPPQEGRDLNEAKLIAWRYASVGSRPSGATLGRPDRGQLPDIDWSIALAKTERRGLAARFARWVRHLLNSRAAPDLSGDGAADVGESRDMHYIGDVLDRQAGTVGPLEELSGGGHSRAA